MRFDIYGRFQVDVRREHGTWVVYRAQSGTHAMLSDVVIPHDVAPEELATYLDDLFHEYATLGRTVKGIGD